MKITLYSTHCPRCTILEKKLNMANIEYETVEDVDRMIAKGYSSIPMLEVDDKVMDFGEAVIWLNNKEYGSTEDTGECATCKL